MVFANRYTIKQLLGKGGYGQVWLAFDENHHRDVALKLFTNGDPLTFATREAIALTALEGPHILRVLNADKYQDVPYVATEVAPGGSTQDHIGEYGVRPDLAIQWIRHALVGLTVCHTRGLLHRDVKPANVFLATDDHALLGDFGVADNLDDKGRALPAGTPWYRPPETWTEGFQTVRSDVYSAGLSLYVLLTGFTPFERATEADVRAAVLEQRQPRVRDLSPHIPGVIQRRIERAMAFDPADRYPTANDFHEALGRPPASGRTWHRITPHSGHYRCWEGGTHANEADLTVCASVGATGRFEVETRRLTGNRPRILNCCGSAPDERALGVLLRRIFDRL